MGGGGAPNGGVVVEKRRSCGSVVGYEAAAREIRGKPTVAKTEKVGGKIPA